MQTVGAGLAGQGNGVEEGALQKQITRSAVDATVLAPHHASDGQGTLVIGNDQRIGTQADLLAIQQDQLLALFGHAHTNAAIDFGKIEGMQRLAQLEHDVVGDINGGIDTADVRTTQAFDHPQRRRARQIDVADHSAEITRAGLGRQHFHRTCLIVGRGDRMDCHLRNVSAIDGTDFTSQPRQRQAIATVGRQADLDGRVIQLQIITKIPTDRRICRQLHQTTVVVAHLQLGLRAQHAVGFDAAQLGLLDLEVTWQLGTDHGEWNLQARTHIGRSADHLEGFRTVTDLANAQLVGIGMLLGAQHLPDHHTTELAGNRGHRVHFEADHGQPRDQFVARNIRVYPSAQPLFTEFHPALLKEFSLTVSSA